MKYPKVFNLTEKEVTKNLPELVARGLVVSEKSTHTSDRRTAQITNPTAGEVVGYSLLASKFKNKEISQKDARILLAIESNRAGGPRSTHVPRLISRAYADDRAAIESVVYGWQNGG